MADRIILECLAITDAATQTQSANCPDGFYLNYGTLSAVSDVPSIDLFYTYTIPLMSFILGVFVFSFLMGSAIGFLNKH